MKKGITLISVVITIIATMILAGITIMSSLDTTNQSLDLRNEVEFDDVANYVRIINTRVEAGLLELNLKNTTLATDEEVELFYAVSGDFTTEKGNKIKSINSSKFDDPNSGFHYVKGKDIQNDTIPGLEGISLKDKSFVSPNKVQNDYIINFYTGAVVGRISPKETRVKGNI